MGTESFYGEIPEKMNVGAYGRAYGGHIAGHMAGYMAGHMAGHMASLYACIWDLCHTTINGMKIWIMGTGHSNAKQWL